MATLVKAGDIVVRLDDTVTKANLAIVTKNLDAAWARAARLEAEQRGTDKIKFPPQLTDRAGDPDVARRDGERDQAVRRPRQRPRRPEGAIARARHPAERGDLRPLGAGQGQGSGNRAGGEGARRRQRSLRQAPGADFAPDHARARPGPPQRRERAIRLLSARRPRARSPRPSCKSSRSTRTWSARSPRICARPTTRSANIIERKVTAEDQLRRVDIRAPQDGIVAAVHGAYRRRRDHGGRCHHADRAAERRSAGRGQGAIRRTSTSCRSGRRPCCGFPPSTSAPRRN